jgi:hypothetical protein
MNKRTLKLKFVIVILAMKLIVQKLYLNIQKFDFLVENGLQDMEK